VPKIRRIADCFIVLEQLFQCRSLGQIPIAGVHTDDAIRHVSPLVQRIVSGNNRIRWIVLNAEELSLDNCGNQFRGTHPVSERTADTPRIQPCSRSSMLKI
jgi:hypothetical protein